MYLCDRDLSHVIVIDCFSKPRSRLLYTRLDRTSKLIVLESLRSLYYVFGGVGHSVAFGVSAGSDMSAFLLKFGWRMIRIDAEHAGKVCKSASFAAEVWDMSRLMDRPCVGD
jgi:hypothetical protein